MRWDIWLALNAGLVLLLIGIPTITHTLIVTGGTLVGIAAILLIKQLIDLHPTQAPRKTSSMEGRKFYITGLSYLVVGGLVGTGLWLGWSESLHIASPIEVGDEDALGRRHGFMVVLLHGVVNLLLGIAVWRQWPLSGLWVIGLFVGIDMLLNGWSLVMLGLAAKNLPTSEQPA